MPGVATLYRSSVGKKIVMAVTGVILYGFVVMHMIGNLKVYLGQEPYNHYARSLREIGSGLFGHGGLLWLARIVLLVAVILHTFAATQLAAMSRAARGVPYAKSQNLSFSYASGTMRWGGAAIAAFVVYHLLHLTFGSAHPQFVEEDVYHNVVTGFQVWPVSLAYILAMIPLGFHMYHGLWSITQTLALDDPRILRWRRLVSAGLAVLVVAGNISMPLAVLAGLVR